MSVNLASIVTPAILAVAKTAMDSWQLPASAKNPCKAHHGACRGVILRAVLRAMPEDSLRALARDIEALARVMVAVLKHCNGLRDAAGCIGATVPAWTGGKTPPAIPHGPAILARETILRDKATDRKKKDAPQKGAEEKGRAPRKGRKAKE